MVKNRYGLEIRAATGTDAAGIGELLAAADCPVPPLALARRLDAVRQGQGTVLLALEWGPPSGIVVLHWYPTLDADLATARIDLLLVGPEQRRRGIGRMLLKAAAQAARVAGCGALRLDVAPEQAVLRRFAEATGFAAAGEWLARPLRKKA